MKKQINLSEQSITFTFDNPHGLEGLSPVVLHVPSLSDEVLEYAQYHGLQARIGDNAALSRKSADGTVITVTEAMRRDAVLELVNHYETGTKEWGLRVARVVPQNPTILAIAAKLGCTYEEAQAKVAEQFLADVATAQ